MSWPLFADDLIRIEGESANASIMKGHGWYDSIKRGELSGGDWLSNFAKGAITVAEYQFEVKEGGEHEFWLRANPSAGAKLSVRLNGGEWREVAMSKKRAIDQSGRG